MPSSVGEHVKSFVVKVSLVEELCIKVEDFDSDGRFWNKLEASAIQFSQGVR